MTELEPQARRLGYARVSTYGQTLDAQIAQLRAEGCAKMEESLSADRAVTASYFANQVTESTSFSASLSRQLLRRFALGLSAGYTAVTYISSRPGNSALGGYNYYSFAARLGCPFLKRGTVSVSYQFSNNSSGQAGLSFSSNQFGAELAYAY